MSMESMLAEGAQRTGDLLMAIFEGIGERVQAVAGAVVEKVSAAANAVGDSVKGMASGGMDSLKQSVGLGHSSEPSQGVGLEQKVGLSAQTMEMPKDGVSQTTQEISPPQKAAYAQIDGMNLKNCLGENGVTYEASHQQIAATDIGQLAAPTAINHQHHQQQQAQAAGMGAA